jgi:3-deoxy-D-manno-octulosonic-acid transferase
MYLLYTLLGLLYCAVLAPAFLYEAVRYKKYVGTLGQRLGYLPVSFNPDGDEAVWIHAVSVGEVLTARALIGEIRDAYPRLRLFLSTTTIAGQQVARSVPGVDAVFYFPLDIPFIDRRILRLVRPRLFVMMETEIWPNLLRECRALGVRTILINGRISARSYPRYRLVRGFLRRVLNDIDHLCVQSAESGRRLIALGADPGRMTTTGSLKFDSLKLPASRQTRTGDDRVLRFFQVRADRLVIVAGSTLRGEEAALFRAFDRVRGLARDVLLVIAPRHPERFAEVERLARDAGFDTVRRTDLPIDAEPSAEVVVLDTIGELAQLYQVATIVFVGGSLVAAGGHNILEPAIFGKPIVFGPHMENFAEIAEAFITAGAGIQLRSESELEPVLRRLLRDPGERTRLGASARAVVETNRGAKEKSLDAITRLLPPETVAAPAGRSLRLVR